MGSKSANSNEKLIKKTKSPGVKRKIQKSPKMAVKVEVIEIDDSSPSPVAKRSPLRSIFCLKNREDIEKIEKQEDCFIFDFNPDNDKDVLRLTNGDNHDDDLSVVAEKGQVACRDYPHSRSSCANFPFEKTPHVSHCKRCYCYVCDVSAPCKKWTSHCHAFNNEAWNEERKVRRQSTKTV